MQGSECLNLRYFFGVPLNAFQEKRPLLEECEKSMDERTKSQCFLSQVLARLEVCRALRLNLTGSPACDDRCEQPKGPEKHSDIGLPEIDLQVIALSDAYHPTYCVHSRLGGRQGLNYFETQYR